VARDARRSRGGRQQRREHQDRGGLAGAVRAEEAVDLAGLDAQVDAVDGARPVLELADEALDLDPVRGRPVHGDLTLASYLRVSTFFRDNFPRMPTSQGFNQCRAGGLGLFWRSSSRTSRGGSP
jgi:hypothetical protein